MESCPVANSGSKIEIFFYLMGERQPRASPTEFAKALAVLTSSKDTKRDRIGDTKDDAAATASPRSFTAKVARFDTGFHQICSSLMVAQGIQSLHLTLLSTRSHGASRSQFVLWLFHTLFSSSATHGIRHVSLPIVSLSDEMVDSMTLYSQCGNPAALLYNQKIWGPIDLARECQRPPKRASIAKGTTVTFRQSATKPMQSVRLEQSISCDVLCESKNQSVHVIVPGYGHCRVPPNTVVWEEDDTATRSRLSPSLDGHSIKSLTINGAESSTYENTRRFGAFLALIARPT